jgi:hypothetical protein
MEDALSSIRRDAPRMIEIIGLAIKLGNKRLFDDTISRYSGLGIRVADPEKIVSIIDQTPPVAPAVSLTLFVRQARNRACYLSELARHTPGAWIRMIRATVFAPAATVAQDRALDEMMKLCCNKTAEAGTPEDWTELIRDVVRELSIERVTNFLALISPVLALADQLNWDRIASGLWERMDPTIEETYDLAFRLSSFDGRFHNPQRVTRVDCWGRALILHNAHRETIRKDEVARKRLLAMQRRVDASLQADPTTSCGQRPLIVRERDEIEAASALVAKRQRK